MAILLILLGSFLIYFTLKGKSPDIFGQLFGANPAPLQ